MKPFDRLLMLLLALLLLAMVITLLFGKGRSRHGYGLLAPAQRAAPSQTPDRIALRGPGIDTAVEIVDLRVATPRQKTVNLRTA
jgi:hypothetical protein